MPNIIICKQCAQKFEAKPSAKRKFCSQNCYNISRIGIPVWNKGLTQEDHPSIRRISQKITGRVPWNKGKPHSKETKQKIGEANKGKTSWMKGKHHTEEALQKISNVNKGKKFSEEQRKRISGGHKGILPWNNGLTKENNESLRKMAEEKKKYLANKENHPSWLGGISFEPYDIDFDDDLKDKIHERDVHVCQVCTEKENGRKLDTHHINYDKQDNRLSNLISLCHSCHVKTNFNRKKWIASFIS